jgi:hypothetical protein
MQGVPDTHQEFKVSPRNFFAAVTARNTSGIEHGRFAFRLGFVTSSLSDLTIKLA